MMPLFLYDFESCGLSGQANQPEPGAGLRHEGTQLSPSPYALSIRGCSGKYRPIGVALHKPGNGTTYTRTHTLTLTLEGEVGRKGERYAQARHRRAFFLNKKKEKRRRGKRKDDKSRCS